MGFGRVVCVFVPFALTAASIITLLVACLAGITDKSSYNFKINTTDFSISASEISSLLSSRSEPLDLSARDTASDLHSGLSSLISTGSTTADSATDVAAALTNTNITAEDLGLADAYYISIWNYCEHSNNGTTTCSKGKFDWATNATKTFENTYKAVVSSTGGNTTIPSSLKSGMNTFAVVTKWTEICFIIAFVFLGATIIFGIFANCTRFFSICATLVAIVAAIAVLASAGLATGAATVVVGLAKGSAKAYGVNASYNRGFLVNVWLSAAFIIAAVLFWLFSICCCAPDHHRRSRGGGSKYADKTIAAQTGVGASTGRGYQPLRDPEMPQMSSAYNGGAYGYGGQGEAGNYYNNNNSGSAYEPYKHTRA